MNWLVSTIANAMGMLGSGVILLSVSGCILGLVGGVAFVVGRWIVGMAL